MKHYVEFIVDRVVYYKPESNWGVFAIRTSGLADDLDFLREMAKEAKKDVNATFVYNTTITGVLGRLTEGEIYEGEATVEHTKFGKQLKAAWVKRKVVQGEDQIFYFLKNIVSSALAKQIASAYPNLINDVMAENVTTVATMRGVGNKTSERIISHIKDNFALMDIITMLAPLGVTHKMIEKISSFHKNPDKIKEMLLENPYKLTKINGLGFKKVDEIALKLNPEIEDSIFRVRAFVSHILKEEANNSGSTLIQKSVLDVKISKNIPVCMNKYVEFIAQEKDNPETIVIVDGKIGLIEQKRTEKEIYDLLEDLDSVCTYFKYNEETKSIEKVTYDKKDLKKETVDLTRAIEQTDTKNGYNLTEEQISAVLNTVHNNVTIISGAAGTGKSSVIDCILNVYHGRRIELCALAAKAAQRMMEITGRSAGTIHRLLGYEGGKFAHNETNTLNVDLVIIDEASMVNSYLFLCLLKAIPVGAKIVIVFDYAQLPPIGAGNIASDLLQSNFASVKFSKVHRQAEKSGILMDATKVRNGITPVDYLVAETNRGRITHGELQDMHYYFKESKEGVFKLLINGFLGAIEKNGIDNVFIVLPRKTAVLNSTESVNKEIQDILINQNLPGVSKGRYNIRQGARVIQRKNNYDKNVVNGEIGYMEKVDLIASTFSIRFGDSKVIEYEFDEVSQIELAYALTVHSFQGSQAKVILIGLDTSHFIMLDAFLLYTAMTRAQSVCMLVAQPEAFKACIKNTQQKKRVTFLQQLIQGVNLDEQTEASEFGDFEEYVNSEIDEI